MAEDTGQEKSEQPTPRRLAEARRDGNVARSPDLAAAAGLLAALLLLYALGGGIVAKLAQGARVLLAGQTSDTGARLDDLHALAHLATRVLGETVGPLALLVMLAGAATVLLQVGFLVTVKPLTPSFKKLSPLRGVKNILGPRGLVRLLMSLGKIVTIAAVAVASLSVELPQIIHTAELAPAQAFVVAMEMAFWLAVKLILVLLLLAILDYAYQRYQRTQDLKMSKQDVKDEMKRMDGDPLMKQRRARVARQLAMQRIQAAVPKADVVVTNPTHFAVALQYDAESMAAPRLVAKGADLMAHRIRQLAAQHEVPVVERPPLARALFAAVEIGQEIPLEHYEAVAEVLAYVYRLSGQRAA